MRGGVILRTSLPLVLACFSACISGCLVESRPLPSDSSLEGRFERMRADMDEIRKMSEEDASVIRIDSEFTWLIDSFQWPRPEERWGISRERWDTYRSLFKRIGCPDGIHRRGGDLYIICGTRGMATDGSTKGYAYITRVDPQHVVPELDSATPAEGRPYFKTLAGPWFLYVD